MKRRNHKKVKPLSEKPAILILHRDGKKPEARVTMSYSTTAHALTSYVECHLNNFDLREMSNSFGFSEIYLRELFLKNVKVPVMQYYRRRKIMVSAFELLYSDKKIIDIAMENGFSNHESYTRAFRKIFGISPSQFRLKRPAIGGKQLEAGVFGLDCLVGKEKRSDGLMLQKNEESTILYGIRKIEHGSYGSNTMFPICIKAVSEYLGDDVSYTYIMAVTGAAFRFVWNREMWDLSNIDIYHTLRETNEIYQYGAKALGREFSFLGRNEDTPKEEFIGFIKSNIAKGYPVIALGIIGPPEPCIVAGYEAEGDIIMGWNFFQDDPEFSDTVQVMDNGYFRCDRWWENTDTQAVMCIGAVTSASYSDKEIVKMAEDIMRAREEECYAKGISAYAAWRDMLLDEKWFDSTAFDHLFSKLLVQNDAMVCLSDGRYWGAKYFEELSEKYGETGKEICRTIAKHFHRVSSIAKEMMSLIGDWSDTESMMQNLGNRAIREKIARLIDEAEAEDGMALQKIEELCKKL